MPLRIYALGRVLGNLVSGEPEDGPPLWTSEQARRTVEALILARPADTPAEAAAQAMLLAPLAEDVAQAARSGDPEVVERALWQVERVARSVTDVLVRQAGLAPGDLPVGYFLRPAEDLWARTAADDAFDALMGGVEADARCALHPPQDPPASVLDAIVQAGGVGAERAAAVYRAVLAALAPAPEGE